MTMTDTQTKLCRGCAQVLPLDAFGKVRADRKWRKPKCRECAAGEQRARRANRRTT